MKRYFAGFLSAVILMSMTVGALAASDVSVQAILKQAVTVTLDGKMLELKDATGSVVYPLNYNGTIYLPVRSLGEAFSLEVGWDGDTQSVLLSNKQTENQIENTLTIVDLKAQNRVLLNQYGDIDVRYDSKKKHTLLNDKALLTKEDGEVLDAGLLMGSCETGSSDILQFEADGRASFNSTTVILNKEFSKVTGYVKRKNMYTHGIYAGSFKIIGIDYDMVVTNVEFEAMESGEETEFIYFEADVEGLDQICFTKTNGFGIGSTNPDQTIVGDLHFIK